jgi:Amt family ammonium transporter
MFTWELDCWFLDGDIVLHRMGFNGGNAVIPGASASLAAYVTLSAACSGGISWIAKDWIVSRKLSGLGFCSGMVAGMVCITPCSGYIAPWAALIVGAIAGVVCNFACSIKVRLRIDDSLDVFAIHGVSGLLGTLLCGIFADSKISKLRSFETQVEGGVISGNFIQLAIQLLGSVVVPVYSFCVTVVILYLINKIPGFKLRIEEDNEYDGVDMTELGEIAVDFNFPRSFQYVDEFKE